MNRPASLYFNTSVAMITPRTPTHIGEGRVKQDKNIYNDLIRDLEQQLSRHETAAAVRQGGPTFKTRASRY